jgi:hypothetical protein
MAQVHVTNPSGKKWVVIAVAVVALGAAAYWFTRSEDPSDVARVTDAAGIASSSPVAGASGVAADVFSNPQPSEQDVQVALEQQKVAAKVLEEQPEMKPITGPITERPAFVSPMEWAMLQGVVQQHANPDKELARMVNFLRFMKQMESLEALPKTPANAAKRQLLTNQLTQDLPNRVQQGDLEVKDAQARLSEWLLEAEPNEHLRQQRADAVGKRLVEAGEAYKAAEAAAKGN